MAAVCANLKVFENLLLPALYHRISTTVALADAAREALRRVGYTGSELALPGLARALLLDPELMIYEALLFGLNPLPRSLAGFAACL